MSVKVYTPDQQGSGAFDNGAILENKPVGFPQDDSELKPFSSVFYWAHAWSKRGGLIGLHPHQGFEIISVVLTGEINHFDTKLKKWIPLQAGDVQIIRSGRGISHEEKLLPGSSLFQIWLDPDLGVSLSKEATYDDYSHASMVKEEKEGVAKIHVTSPGPMTKSAPANLFWVHAEQNKTVDLGKAKTTWGVFVLEGEGVVNNKFFKKHDFLVLSANELASFTESTKLFVVEVPQKLPYKTYAERYA